MLSVKDDTTERAKQIVGLLAKELQFELNDLRDMIDLKPKQLSNHP